MSDKEKNLPATTKPQSVQLHDTGLRSGGLIESSLQSLTPEQKEALAGKAAEEALRLEVKAREQNIEYVGGKKALEDHIEAFNMLDKEGKLTRQSLKSEINTGAGKMTVESKSGGVCFVATAAYGDPRHPDVEFLRWFRDNRLARSSMGRQFITWYQRTGPSIARWTLARSWARTSARRVLSVIVWALRRAG